MFEVVMNDKTVWLVENTTPARYEAVKVLAGSDWYTPVDGQIRGLSIRSKAA